MIELRDVHKAFGSNKVLRGVNLTIARGESMVIIGGSGTGKSVALKCILGLVKPDCGHHPAGRRGCAQRPNATPSSPASACCSRAARCSIR